MTLEKEDIQGLLIRGYSKLAHASYHLLQFEDSQGAKAYLRDNLKKVTNAATSPDDLATHLAFTYEGFKLLSVPGETLASFLRQFKEGMTEESRRFVLGDEFDNAPENWEWGGPENDQVHALLMLYASDLSALQAELEVHKDQFKTHKIKEVRELGTQILPESKEHFGFRDAISQPYVSGFSDHQPQAGEEVFPSGEFILGYKNWYDQYPDSPMVAPSEDPDDLLPVHPNDDSFKDLGKNGSYLVFRQMSQDVPCFWKYMKDETAHDGSHYESIKLASKIVGRWPSGAPLVKSPDKDQPGYSTENDFNYWNEDFHGLKCPLGSHIRRTNPRDWLLTETSELESREMVQKHRLLRRGRPYGPPLVEGMNPNELMDAADDGQERGLHFICFVGDLIRQFEFVQNAWVKFHKFSGLYEDSDPLIGTHYQKDGVVTDTFTIQEEPIRKKHKNLPQFTKMQGGAYFFFPGIKALSFLAK